MSAHVCQIISLRPLDSISHFTKTTHVKKIVKNIYEYYVHGGGIHYTHGVSHILTTFFVKPQL